MGSGTITLNRTTAGINKVELSGSNFTFNANTSTIILTNSTANAQAFVGGNSTFNNVTVQGSGNYVTTVSGSNTFNTFTVDRSQAAKTIKFTAGTTQTFSNFIAATSGTTVLTIDSDTTATHALVKTGGGTISSDYLNIQHSVATPANTWYAGANSTNNQATATAGSGWIFSAAYKTLVGKDIGAYQVMTDGTNVYGYINTTNVVSAAIDNTKWHHVVMTYDGATQKIYVDGVLQNSGAVSGAIGTNSSNVEIGQNFAGKIDNVRIYNRALSQTEVTAAYDSYNPGIQISDLQKGLVGQWKMNGNANDSTSYQNNGTVTGATLTTDRKGQVNKAYSFDGVGNYVNVGDPTNGSLDFGTGDFSISMWAKVQSNTSGLAKGILDKSGFGTTAGYSLFHIEVGDERGSNLVGFSIEDSTGVHNEVDSTSVVGNNQWHHIVGTFISSSDTLSIYVDGKLEKTDSDTALGNISSSGNLYLWARNNGTAVENGLIDEVRIWNRALSADEITALYQEYDPGIAVSNLQKGLVGQWKFDGNANDSTSYQNNGTVTGATLTTDRKGQVNKAYSFNGTSDYINAGNGASLNITGDITIAVWAKMNNVSGIYNLVGNTRTSYYGYRFIISAGQLGFNTVQSGANQLTYSSPILTTGVWYHLVATRSGTVAKTYINGEDKTSTPATHIDPVSSAATLKIGVYSYSPTTQFFRGLIDEVRVWNRALSAAEVKALYESY